MGQLGRQFSYSLTTPFHCDAEQLGVELTQAPASLGKWVGRAWSCVLCQLLIRPWVRGGSGLAVYHGSEVVVVWWSTMGPRW